MEWHLFVVLALLAVAIVGAIVFFALRGRNSEETDYFHLRCPGCNRKLRQRLSRIGHKVQCPLCKHVFILALPGPAERL